MRLDQLILATRTASPASGLNDSWPIWNKRLRHRREHTACVSTFPLTTSLKASSDEPGLTEISPSHYFPRKNSDVFVHGQPTWAGPCLIPRAPKEIVLSKTHVLRSAPQPQNTQPRSKGLSFLGTRLQNTKPQGTSDHYCLNAAFYERRYLYNKRTNQNS